MGDRGNPETDAQGQSDKKHAGDSNNGVSSANPRVLSNDDGGDATFPHTATEAEAANNQRLCFIGSDGGFSDHWAFQSVARRVHRHAARGASEPADRRSIFPAISYKSGFQHRPTPCRACGGAGRLPALPRVGRSAKKAARSGQKRQCPMASSELSQLRRLCPERRFWRSPGRSRRTGLQWSSGIDVLGGSMVAVPPQNHRRLLVVERPSG